MPSRTVPSANYTTRPSPDALVRRFLAFLDTRMALICPDAPAGTDGETVFEALDAADPPEGG